MIDAMFEKFVEETPITVMVRGIMERIFEPAALDNLFETYAFIGYCLPSQPFHYSRA